MSDEIKHATNGSGGGDGSGSPQRGRSERTDFADVVLFWAAAVVRQRAVVDAFDACVKHLQGLGATLDGVARDRKIVDLMMTIDQMRETEKCSAETREYLLDLKTRLEQLP